MALLASLQFAPAFESFGWEAKRKGRAFIRNFGWSGVVMISCVAVTAVALLSYHHYSRKLTELAATAEALGSMREAANGNDLPERRSGLQEFEDYLLAHEEIPQVLQGLMALAESEGLTLRRGEYRPQLESRGEFMRYQMTLPVKGGADAIHRFMLAALKNNRTLALETVHFKRERSRSNRVEARIQWALMTRLPHRDAKGNAGSGSGGS